MNLFEALIKELAEATGLPLQVSADNSCCLESDDMLITLQYRQECDDVVFFAPILTPDEDEQIPAGVLRKALELSYNGIGTHGAFLGLFNGALVLSVTFPMNGLDAHLLGARILAFTETAQGIALELESVLLEEQGFDVQQRSKENSEMITEQQMLFKA